MNRIADMTEEQLVDAVRSINGALISRPLSARARKKLEASRESLIEELSLRDEDRAEDEEQRRVDQYLDEVRS